MPTVSKNPIPKSRLVRLSDRSVAFVMLLTHLQPQRVNQIASWLGQEDFIPITNGHWRSCAP